MQTAYSKELAELRETNERLRDQLDALSRRLVEVQESERRHLSRELHDRIGANLTALSINLAAVRSRLLGEDGAQLRARIDDSIALVDATADGIDNLLTELRPPRFDCYGLHAALQLYAQEFSQRTGIEVVLNGEELSDRPRSEVEISLFRIAQEALNNVAKHARAARVELTLRHTHDECVLSVSDNGVGFDPAPESPAARKPGRGLHTMRERAEAIGGHFELRAHPGNGTHVTVRVPLRRSADNA